MKNGSPLRILLDEGAPVAVAEPFLQRSYHVIYHGDVLPSGAKDPLVAATAVLNSAVLVAQDKDMKQMAKRFGNPVNGWRYPQLNLVFLNCSGVLASKRVEHLMTFIEHEWKVTCEKTARTMWVDIGAHYLRSYR